MSLLTTVAAIAVLLIRHRSVRGTTLLAPWWWACGSLIGLVVVELLLFSAVLEPRNSMAWRFLASSSTLCPGIALLGAKRPQDASWQWIVASLWLVLGLPALQQLVLDRSGRLDPHWVRGWFLLGILLFGVANSLVSRHWPAVVLAGGGQVVLLLPYLPMASRFVPAVAPAWGMMAVAAAVLVTQLRPRKIPARPTLNRAWLDFRNSFGLVWSLRFMERVNAVAEHNRWGIVLRWSGFQTLDGSHDSELPPVQLRLLRQSMANLLRRFVSPEWIETRLGQSG